jgi:hypothetical protein
MVILAYIVFCVFSFLTATFIGSFIASVKRAVREGNQNPRAIVSVILCVLINIPNVFIASYIRHQGNVKLTFVISTACVVLGLLIGLKNKNA